MHAGRVLWRTPTCRCYPSLRLMSASTQPNPESVVAVEASLLWGRKSLVYEKSGIGLCPHRSVLRAWSSLDKSWPGGFCEQPAHCEISSVAVLLPCVCIAFGHTDFPSTCDHFLEIRTAVWHNTAARAVVCLFFFFFCGWVCVGAMEAQRSHGMPSISLHDLSTPMMPS